VNRTTLFAALACALLVFSMLGCGTTEQFAVHPAFNFEHGRVGSRVLKT
jgi:hypothetical protein